MDGQPPGEAAARSTPSPLSLDTRKPPPNNLRITELATDPMVLATSPDHPHASRDQIPLSQLRDDPMVAAVGPVGPSTANTHANLLADNNVLRLLSGLKDKRWFARRLHW